MNDLITAATSGLFVEVGKVIEHMKAQQERIAELESRIEFNGDHSHDGIVKRDERIADLERQLAEASAPAVGKLVSIDEMCKILDATLIKSTERTDCTILHTVTFDQLRDLYMKGMASAPPAADTDKVREAIRDVEVSTSGSKGYAKAFDDGAETMREAIAGIFDDMAAQAPVREVPGWVCVNDELPDEETDVVVYQYSEGFGHHFAVAGLFGGEWLSAETEDDCRFQPTHWLALPAAPVAKGE